jgi:hypothetical protein
MTSPGPRDRDIILAYSGGVMDRAAGQRIDPGFAADLSQAAEPSALEAAGGERVLDLRTLVGTLTPAEAALLATRGESCTGTAISSTAAAAGPRPASVTAGTSGPAGTRHAAACTSRGSSPR